MTQKRENPTQIDAIMCILISQHTRYVLTLHDNDTGKKESYPNDTVSFVDVRDTALAHIFAYEAEQVHTYTSNDIHTDFVRRWALFF